MKFSKISLTTKTEEQLIESNYKLYAEWCNVPLGYVIQSLDDGWNIEYLITYTIDNSGNEIYRIWENYETNLDMYKHSYCTDEKDYEILQAVYCRSAKELSKEIKTRFNNIANIDNTYYSIDMNGNNDWILTILEKNTSPLEQLNKQILEKKKELKELEDKRDKLGYVEEGTVYYYINDSFEVVNSIFSKTTQHQKRMDIGNCFPNYNEAIKYKELIVKNLFNWRNGFC